MLTAADVADSPLRSWLDAHLLQLDDRWVALTSLVAPEPEELARFIADAGADADLVDGAYIDLLARHIEQLETIGLVCRTPANP